MNNYTLYTEPEERLSLSPISPVSSVSSPNTQSYDLTETMIQTEDRKQLYQRIESLENEIRDLKQHLFSPKEEKMPLLSDSKEPSCCDGYECAMCCCTSMLLFTTQIK